MSNIHTVITSDEEAEKKIMAGISKAEKIVGDSMGYQGTLNLKSINGLAGSTKDGFSILNKVFLQDPVEALACEVAKQASKKTVDEAGDSTSATIVLLKAFLQRFYDSVKKGKSAIELKNDIEKSVEKVVDYLDEIAVELTEKMIFDIAKTSANGDEEVAQLVANAFKQAGENGSVGHVRSNNDQTFYEHTDGTLVERGFVHEGFVNKHSNQSVTFEDNPLVLISNLKFNTIAQLTPFLTFAHRNKRELLIISEMEFDVENILLSNKIKNDLKVCIINPPAIGKKRTELLSDLALVCNTQMIDVLSGADFNGREAMFLGIAKSIVVTKDNTVIVKHDETPTEPIDGKVAELKEQLKLVDKNYVLKKNIESRIAKLSGGISMIKVGGLTPSEVDEKIDRVEDAICAIRSAKEEGVVAGGGTALFSAFKKIQDLDEVTKYAIQSPFYRILNNANYHPYIKPEKVKISKCFFWKKQEYKTIYIHYVPSIEYPNGYDVKKLQEVNMFDAGIIDSKKAIKNALINSVSSCFVLARSRNVLTYSDEQ